MGKVKGIPLYSVNEVKKKRALEEVFMRYLSMTCYDEIRLPIIEHADIFTHDLGQGSDIVTKEMYHLRYRGKQELVLRPEGTAGFLNLLKEQKLETTPGKYWYYGPMFRHEKVGHDRKRVFYQLGLESVGYTPLSQEYEILLMTWDILKSLGLADKVKLHLNYLGTKKEQNTYSEAIRNSLKAYEHTMTSTALKTLYTNPIRLLDSKEPCINELRQHIPPIDSIIEPSKDFVELCKNLSIPLVIDQSLVRGLDYYSATVCEWIAGTESGSIGAGGRYDDIAHTSAFGLALGIDRILLLYNNYVQSSNCHYYVSIQDTSLYSVFYNSIRKHIEGSVHVYYTEGESEHKTVNHAFMKGAQHLIILKKANELVHIVKPSYHPTRRSVFTRVELLYSSLST